MLFYYKQSEGIVLKGENINEKVLRESDLQSNIEFDRIHSTLLLMGRSVWAGSRNGNLTDVLPSTSFAFRKLLGV